MSSIPVGIIVCNTYAKELEHVMDEIGIEKSNVLVAPFVCASFQPAGQKKIMEKVDDFMAKCRFVVSIPNSECSCCSIRPGNNESCCSPQYSMCTNWLFQPDLVEHFISGGYYIVSPGWLRQWKHTVKKNWGFTEEIAPAFFAESAKKILVIDTGIYDDCEKNAKEFASFAQLPYTILPVGIHYFKNIIKLAFSLASEQFAREENTKRNKEYMKTLSEYSMIFNLVKRLSTIDNEEVIYSYIFEMAKMFFAPQKLAIFTSSGKILFNTTEFEIIDSDINTSNTNVVEMASQRGFAIKFIFGDECFGYLIVDDVIFQDALEGYKEMALVLAPLFGLLVSNITKINQIRHDQIQAQENSQKYKKLYYQYVEKNDELLALNATKDKFFSIISHDLRSPFASLIGLSEILNIKLKRGELESSSEIANQISHVTNSSLEMLENLLKWSQVQTGRLKPHFDVISSKGIFESVKHQIEVVARNKNISLIFDTSQNVNILADANMVETVLRNIVSNAIKFTFPDGTVHISISTEKGYARFAIIDNGTGMSETTATNIFKISANKSLPGTNNEHGSGLGLILCKEFIELNNGKIWVVSEIGNGSSFYFTIPLAPQTHE